jgi:hypothetical protein
MSPLHVPQQGPYGERCSISRANGLFIYLYPSESPVKEPTHENGKHKIADQGASRGRKAYIRVQWGAVWFRKGIVNDTAITTPVACSLQYDTFHLGLGRQEPR